MRWVIIGAALASCVWVPVARANITCNSWGSKDGQFIQVAPLPGTDDYDPETYADYLYYTFQQCFEAQDCIVLSGELTVLWDLSKPLPHEMAQKQQEEFYSEGNGRGYGVSYDYSYFYDFEGSQISQDGLRKVEPTRVDLSVGAGEEGFWNSVVTTDGPSIINAEYWFTREGALGLNVYSAHTCASKPLPAPDEAALRALTACIRNHGC
ncbi:MAG: hypothetical protein EBT13_05095 [Rhodobacteraceae bacterium]|nr:hypothetical protein [Paracoccaceae bacterium]